jgi:ribosomal protein S18 acetylase RimI-like enzyme
MNLNNKVIVEQVTILTPLLVDELFKLALQLNPQVQKESFSSTLQKIIEYTGARLFVAKENDLTILGMLTMITYPHMTNIEGEKTWIEDVVVDTNSRGQGIGKKLIQEAIYEAKSCGIEYINLTSNPKRIAANQLYKKLGFQQHKTNYYYYKLS